MYVTIKLILNQIKRYAGNQVITDVFKDILDHCYELSVVVRSSPPSQSKLWATKHWKKYLQGRSAPGSIRVST